MIDRRAIVLAVAGFAGCIVGLVLVPRETLAAWLVCWLSWGAIPIGALGAAMMLALVPGSWRDLYREPFALGAALMPVAALAALPLLAGVKLIYPWTDPAIGGVFTGFKAAWLSTPFFVIREAVIVSALTLLAWLLLTAGERSKAAMAAAGILAYGLLGSIVGIDFAESTEPRFHSSIYGLFALTSQWLVAIAFGVFLGFWRNRKPAPFAGAGVLATAILLWGYMHAMQYIVIWSGNIPAEAHWYIVRGAGPWRAIGWAGFALQAIVPFILLLAPSIRNNPLRMMGVGGMILLAAPLQQAWMILPGLGAYSWASIPLIIASSAAMLGSGWIAAEALQRRVNGSLLHG